MRSYCFILTGKMKSGKNHIQITRTGKRYPKPEFVEWRTNMLAQMPAIKQPFVGPVRMGVYYIPGDRLRRDAPGMLDALLHLLEKHGVVLDDAQVKKVSWEEAPIDRINPRCSVVIERFIQS